ncbi:MAG: transporter substrate-binding domain-containing protein [Proteobacteria bacterium]|nr:transporter substrate-binding domain-containing protein [Pseudomonadota bacterium]
MFRHLKLFFCGIIFSFLMIDVSRADEANPNFISEEVEDFESFQEVIPASLHKTLKVGVYEEAPFAFRDEKKGEYQGISIDIWEKIARKNGFTFQYFPVTQEEGINKICKKEYDLLVGRIPDFPRKPGMDFQYTIPIYVSGIGLAYVKPGNFNIIFNYLISWDFLMILLALLGCLFLQAGTFWVFEHKKNPDYKKSFWKGIGSGLWWSTGIVTSANIDEGETKTLVGRVVAGCWMFASLLAMNILIASVASELTVGKLSSQIQDLEDLKKLGKVITVSNTFGQNLLEKRFIPHKIVNSLDEALKDLENGKARVLVYSEPLLRFFLHAHPIPDVNFTSSGFGVRYYSMIVQEPSDLLRIINRDIMDLMNAEAIAIIVEKYLGKRDI